MNQKQLLSEVAHLGFEREITDVDGFISSLRQALNLLYTDRPVIRTVKRYIERILPCSLTRVYTHEGTDSTFKLSGRAFSFISTGQCSFTLRGEYTEKEVSLPDGYTEYRQLTDSYSSITFSGDNLYTILSLACYDRLPSMDETDIPIYGQRAKIDIGRIYGDFVSFIGLPTDKDGRTIDGSVISGGCAVLPKGFHGEVNLAYKRAPKLPSGYNETEEVDVSRESEGLLSLLCASFMWLDDDADKAQYYMALYRETVAGIGRSNTDRLKTDYTTNGWA